ncbi:MULTISPECIES: xanthine dehydrogenase family protein molybdopterin-binding subunit [unclassified Marinobacter]|jgi:isoquinoline 1-oxidoreductase/isoquinoline 1-oxidoreductase beta subunit|uniref:xanthine dehydrogenase family protein molybdopterin-binding subunit n=1 Tax=unclassified Marinobacter TaxID=83889 RepID=UPI0018F25157|nr:MULTISPECIES: molybdopterin cofactor-binding domain-containing protein [unclassified Marinobacter]
MAMNRRDFLKVSTSASGGLVLSLSLPGCATVDTGYSENAGIWRPDAWLEIQDNGNIYFTLARVEMGQGTYTGLTTLIAEELDVEPASIKPRFAPVAKEYLNPAYKLQITGGSTSVATSWEPLRRAGAEARYMLMMAAAKVWQVETDNCSTQDGRVVHPNGIDSLPYARLASLAASEIPRIEVPLKPRSEWKYIGKQMKRLDAEAKATGTAVYGIDIEQPGMLYAVVTRPPRYGAKVKSFNKADVTIHSGVKDVFEIERGVAVVATSYWRARKAQRALQVEWDNDDAITLSTESVFHHYYKDSEQDAGVSEREDGDYAQAEEQAGKVLHADYEQPYLAHFAMEPMNATAWYKGDAMEVWASTQAPDLGRIAAARGCDLSPGDITIHTTFLGGGFGRRLTNDYIEEAAAVSYRMKAPVKLVWSREEDTQHSPCRPAMLHRMRAAVSGNRLEGWHHQIVGPQILDWYITNAAPAQYPWAPKMLYNTLGRVGLAAEGLATPKDVSAIEGAIDYPYQVPNVELRHTHSDPGFPITWWRSVGYSHNGFAVETFMDEIAHELGEDPIAFRRARLQNQPRHLKVLDRVAEMSRWNSTSASGRAKGVAVFQSFGTFVAQVVEASIEGSEIKVHKVWCAVDCGQVVNPSVVSDQIKGGILFGLSAALWGEITLADGKVQQSNFHDYPVMAMHNLPDVELDIVDSNEAPTGVGEPGVPPVIPALGNALFRLTGVRQRRLPLKATG